MLKQNILIICISVFMCILAFYWRKQPTNSTSFSEMYMRISLQISNKDKYLLATMTVFGVQYTLNRNRKQFAFVLAFQ